MQEPFPSSGEAVWLMMLSWVIAIVMRWRGSWLHLPAV